MAQPITPIAIEHYPAIHQIEPSPDSGPRPLTLLELVEAVSEVTDDEQEIVETVAWMLQSGRVKLVGNFRDAPISQLCS
jgi:hypothetical protein